MIALDTNILARYFIADDPEQSAQATAVIERTIERDEQLFVPQLVLCELVWVLSHTYRLNRDEVVSILHQLRRGAQVVIEGADEVRRAIDAYAAQRGDFADYLLAERSFANGCSTVATFDRVLHSDARFQPPHRIR